MLAPIHPELVEGVANVLDVAGGEIPLGIVADYTSDDAQLLDMLKQIITARLVAELNLSEDED